MLFVNNALDTMHGRAERTRGPAGGEGTVDDQIEDFTRRLRVGARVVTLSRLGRRCSDEQHGWLKLRVLEAPRGSVSHQVRVGGAARARPPRSPHS